MNRCEHCGRDRFFPCRNTRDMDRSDGENSDYVCNLTLVLLGGGERGRPAAKSFALFVRPPARTE